MIGLFKSVFCSLVLVGTRKSWIVPYFFNVEPCVVANLLAVFKRINFGCKILISFQVGMFIMFDSAPESNKNSISRAGV